MVTADNFFLQRLGISQVKAAKALGVSQPSVSAGIAKEYIYFDSKKIDKMRNFFRENDSEFLPRFEATAAEFMDNPENFQGMNSVLDADPSVWNADQVLSIGYDLPEVTSPTFARKLISPWMSTQEHQLIYVVPDLETGRIVFNSIAEILEVEPGPDVFLLQMPIARFFSELRILNPLTDFRRTYARTFGNALQRLEDGAAIPFIKLFRLHGLALNSLEFSRDLNRRIDSEDISTLAGPDDFRSGKFPSYSNQLRSMA